jgi:hypothetical protein
MSETCRHLDQKRRAQGAVAEDLDERFGPVRTVAVAVMIDGSARAREIAAAITGAARELIQAGKVARTMSNAEGLELMTSRLSELTALLGRAEKELVSAARADFGVPD